jgi:hypothetical protein
VFAGPDYYSGKIALGKVTFPLTASMDMLKWYSGYGSANSFSQPMYLNDGPREDIHNAYPQVAAGNPGYWITATSDPISAFGTRDGHFIRTDINGMSADNCPAYSKQTTLMSRGLISTSGSTAFSFTDWGIAAITTTPYPVDQKRCRPACTVFASFTRVISNTTVAFTNTSTGNGTLSYTWNFGDGTISNLKDPVHTYPSSGKYSVTLNVNNISLEGDTCSSSAYDTVTVSCGVKSDFTTSLGMCKRVTFTATPTGTGPFTYLWIFQDGSTATSTNAIKTYPACGRYWVKLVTRNSSCIDTAFKYIEIPCCSVSADFCLQDSGTSVKLIYTPLPASSAYTCSYSVYVDGVLTAWTANSYKTFTPGTHQICLKVKKITCPGVDSCCATCCKSINVAASLASLATIADFWYQMQPNGNVLFTNKTTPATGFTCVWDFGEPGSSTNISTALSPSHTYAAPGNYLATLKTFTVIGPDTSVVSVKSLPISIAQLCKVSSKFISKICLNTDLVDFINYSTGASKCTWEWDDGTASVPPNPMTNPFHSWGAPGVYNVCLTAQGPQGLCSSKTCQKIAIYPTSCTNNCTATAGMANLTLPAENSSAKIMSANEVKTDNADVMKLSKPITSELQIFPNPASQNVQFKFLSDLPSTGSMSIQNSTGIVIYSEQIKINSGSNLITIPVRNYANGSYFVRIAGGENTRSGAFTVIN